MFSFKDKTNIQMGIVLENESIFNTSPEINYLEQSVDGLDGSIFTELNYMDVSVSSNFLLTDSSLIDDIKGWLSGEGKLIYDNKYKTARVYSSIDYQKFGFKKTGKVDFILSPFWYKDDDYIDVDDGLIINKGNAPAKPILKLVKTDSNYVDITVNDVRFIYHFTEETEAIIDCLEMTETNPLNIEIDYKYPTLKVHENIVTINAGNAKVYVKRKDRWI